MDALAARAEADAIAALGAAHAEETESLRRLAPPVSRAIVESELAQWWKPTALGGYAGDPLVLLEAIERIAEADASTAWCAGIAYGSNALAAVVDESAAKELFGQQCNGISTFSPTGRLVETDAGFELDGRWPFSSNCHQATYGALGFMRFGEGRPLTDEHGSPKTGLAFLSREQFEIDETWDMAGLRGTGSHDVVATTRLDDAYVSDLFAPKWPTDALFQMRIFDLLGPCLGVVPLGVGRAALAAAEAHIAETGDQPRRGPKLPFGIDAVAQHDFARVDSQLRMATAYVHDCIAEAYEYARQGDVAPRATSARIAIALHAGHAAATAAAEFAVRVVGTRAAREGARLDRLRRDLQAAACHVYLNPAMLPPLGRQAAGLHTVEWPILPPD